MNKVISKKYSKALLEVAEEQGKLADIVAEVDELREVFKASDLAAFFSKEVYSDQDKSKVLVTIENSSSDLMRSFLETIKANGRLADLSDILSEVKTASNNLLKVSDVEVTTAVQLTNSQEQKITELAKAKFAMNDVRLSNKVDERILGGFIIKSRGQIIDASIKSQLAKLAAEIL